MNAEFERQQLRAIGRPTSFKSEINVRRISPRVPRLLVSVRSALEAQRAILGGAEILDVKDPSRGSLGMAAVEDIVAIARLSPLVSATMPLSVALGEVVDWRSSSVVPVLPAGMTFAKLGLSQCVGNSEWRADWRRVRAEFERRSTSILSWVAVAYADFVEARSPSLSDVLDAAIETGCAGLLIDTWTKGDRTLLDYLDVPSMTVIAEQSHAAGLFMAIAGKLDQKVLPALAGVPADILAIRSAACAKSDRTSELDAGRVSEFRNEMRSRFDPQNSYTTAPV